MLVASLIWLAWNSALLLWLIPSSKEDTIFVSAHQQQAQAREVVGVDISLINRLKLFGQGTATAQKVEPVVTKMENVPETRLKLRLMGLRRGSGSIKSSAIVEGPNKKQNIYLIGDKLPSGGAVVEDIMVKKMIISRGGKLETLTLFSKLNAQTSNRNSRVTVTKVKGLVNDLSSSRVVTRKLSKFRNMALKDPLALNGVVNIQPLHSGGKFQGYTLNPGNDSVFFKKSGLKAGDVLTSLNGVELDNPNKVLSLMGILATAKGLDITVTRDGNPVSFKYKF